MSLPERERSARVSASRGKLLPVQQYLTPRRTFRDKTNDQDIMDTLADIAVELGKDLERLQYSGKTVTVKYKVSFCDKINADEQLHTFESEDTMCDVY
jgi:hypothetical protein